jgi:Flp pilus assembly protein TadG
MRTPTRCNELRSKAARANVLRGLRDRLRDDRGSGAAAVLIFALVFMTLAGFVVDGGMSISQRERAADIAEQAARYAAEDINTDQLRTALPGTAPEINYQDCPARVDKYVGLLGINAADIVATCTGMAADRVEVTVELTYKPILTGFFYKKDLTAKGKASAESVTDPG